MYENINDIEKLVDANYFVVAEVMLSSQWLSVLINQSNFMDLLTFFQENINKSK